MLTLPQYIEELGDADAAERFGVKIRTVQSWRRQERFPRPRQAEIIVKAAGGRIDYAGIYGAAAARSEAA